jgi:hypothetical protein
MSVSGSKWPPPRGIPKPDASLIEKKTTMCALGQLAPLNPLRKSKAITGRVRTRVANLARTTASALEGPAARLRRGPLYPVLVALAGITFVAMIVSRSRVPATTCSFPSA